jgi:ribosomal protein S18 acetylase RimI-like enzyme
MILSTPDPALDRSFAAALLRLQHDAYRTQADLIGSDQLVSLTADEKTLPAWRGRYLVAWEGTELVGAVAWRPGSVVDVDRVMVDPPARRRGIATALVRLLLDDIGPLPVEAVTGRDNSPGIALYRRFGFEPVQEEQALSGIWITRLRREP